MKKAFTLIELLIVVAIIGVLVTIVAVNFSGSFESARATKCLANMRALFNAAAAVGMDSEYWPMAGDEYEMDRRDPTKVGPVYHGGWISWLKNNQPLPIEGVGTWEDEKEAFEKGGGGYFWKLIGMNRNVYVCPTYARAYKACQGGEPRFTYVMNSFLQYDYSVGKGTKNPQTSQGGGGPKYPNGDDATGGRMPPASLELLFAELPHPQRAGLPSDIHGRDSILQHKVPSPLHQDNPKWNGYGKWKKEPESIGFVHKTNHGRYCAHVIFRDGHTEKLAEPKEGMGISALDLTELLCTGHGYIYSGGGYRRVLSADEEAATREEDDSETEYAN